MKRTFTFLLTALFLCAGMVKAAVTDVPEMSTEGNIKWYTIKNVRQQKYATYAGESSSMTQQTSVQDGSLFYFTGSVVDGVAVVKIHNAQAGELLCAATNSWTTEGIDWYIAAKTDNGLSISNTADFSGTNSWNDFQGSGKTIDYWTATDAGSIWAVELFGSDIQTTLDKLLACKENPIIGEPAYSEETYNTLAAAYETFNANATIENYNACKDIIAGLETYMPQVGQFYHIEVPLFYNTQGVHKALYAEVEELGWKTLDKTDEAFYWTPVETENGLAWKNAKNGNYLLGQSDNNKAWTPAEKPEGAEFTLVVLKNGETQKDYQYAISVSGRHMHANNHGNGNGAGSTIVSWETNSANSASAWTITIAKDPATLVEATVTYSFTYEGEEKYTQTTTTLLGEEWPDFTVAFPYGVTAVKPEGVVTAEDEAAEAITKVIELEVAELPFVAAEAVDSISKWYYATMHTNLPRYLEENVNGGIDWVKDSVGVNKTDSLLWGFVGNHFDGIKLINKATGHAVVSTSADAVMGDTANATAFILSASSTGVENGFCLKYPEGTYLNAQSGKVASWGANDAGSTFQVYTLPKEELAAFVAKYGELELLTESYPSMYMIGAVSEKFFAVQEAGYSMKENIDNATSETIAEFIALADETIAFVKDMDAKYNEWKEALMACYECQDTTTATNDAAVAAFAAMVDKHGNYQWMMPATSVEEFDALIAELVAAREAFVEAANAPMTPEMEAFLAKCGELQLLTETYPSMYMISAVNEKFFAVLDESTALQTKLLTATAEEISAFITLADETIAFVKAMDAKYNEWKEVLMACYECQDTTTTASAEATAAFAEVVDKHSGYQWMMPATSVEEFDALIAELVAAREAFVKAANIVMTPEMEEFLAKYGELQLLTEAYPSMYMISAVNEKFFAVLDEGSTLQANLATATTEEISAFIALADETIAFVKTMDAKYNEWKGELMACYECQDTTTTASEEATAAFAEVVDKHSSYQWMMPATSAEEFDALIAELVAAREAFINAATSGIEKINANVEQVIYDIHGRRVSTMEKGIYIVNGRKVFVK